MKSSERYSERYLKVNEVAAMLGVSRSTVWRWRKVGFLPAPYKIRERMIRWREKDIEEWMEDRVRTNERQD
jgi:prophage regulatory protein